MTFYFYDVETSGFSPRTDRIMQFAGQRTDMDLNPVGQPDNSLIKMTPDVLPEPSAVLVHGITPQKTLAEGISETEFANYLTSQVSTEDTIIVGYNNIRFDNDFIRFTLWRNFHDAYEWSWKSNCSTWDLLDVVRMTRALRPGGIEWPFAPDGRPTNSLEYISAINKLDHVDAHDAMSDVKASIAVARLLKQKQPKIFEFLLNIRGKRNVAPLVTKGKPLIYTSGRYPSEFEKTTIAVMAAEKPDKSGALMYDLRIDPDEFKDLSVGELAERWADHSEEAPYFPVKLLQYNRCPAIAPLSVLDGVSAKRLKLHKEIIEAHFRKLQKARGFGDKFLEALDRMWPPRQPDLVIDEQKVDGQLYDSFVKDEDRTKMSVVRAAEPNELTRLDLDFQDGRLKVLLPLYKARNFPEALTDTEKQAWVKFRRQKLLGGKSKQADRFFAQIEELGKMPGLNSEKKHLLEDTKEYGSSITRAI
ncbi:MAG TPA: exodeoxyribonuclease I [Candidatus Saccharimonadales bacterium]|nr:exodeoxyribonuclease I [Candidatus Saccharimonadales bacterium]